MAKINLTEYKKTAQAKKDLTQKCKRICRAEGITQQQLAEAVGLSQSQISYLFKKGVSTELVCAIARLTGRKILEDNKDLG